jgi:integrase
MATFTKRKTGWLATVRKAGHDTMCETFDTKKQAETWATQVEADLYNRKKGLVVEGTVRFVFQRYADEVAPTKRGAYDITNKTNTLLGKFSDKRLLPFADRLMSEVTHRDITSWVSEMQKTLGPTSVQNYFEFVYRVFKHARVKPDWGYLKDDPFEGVTWPVKGKPRKRRLEGDELQRLMLALDYEPGQKPTDDKHYVAIGVLLCIESAMRIGELLGVDHESIGKDGRTILLTMTKNGDSRTVPLSAAARGLVKLLPKKGKLIPISTYNRFWDLWDRARRNTRIKDLRIHDMRREACTRLSKKVNEMELAKITGHRDTKILFNTYYAPDMGEMADRL